MTEVKYDICQEVVFFNTATCKFEKGEIKGIQIIPTGIAKDSEGKNVLDGYMVLYTLQNNAVLAEPELFVDEESAREHLLSVLNNL